MFTRGKPGFFQFCSFLNMVNHLDMLCSYWFFSTHIYRRLSTYLDSAFTKKLVSALSNAVAARIFLRVEIGNLHQKTQLGFILTIIKNVQDRFHSLQSIAAISTAATLTRKKTVFFELLLLLIFNRCWYATISLCRLVSALR